MDLNMPIMNGLEATRRIKAEFPQITVVGLSVDETTAKAMRDAGAAAFLSKGGSFDTLCATIREQKGDVTTRVRRVHGPQSKNG